MNPSITRDQIIEEAKTWIGTPIQHQGRLKGVGVDCVGFVSGVFMALGCKVRYRHNYSKLPDGDELLSVLRDNLHEIEVRNIQKGDIVVFKGVYGRPQHLAFIDGYPIDGEVSIIHSYWTVGKIVQHRLDPKWRRRIVTAFRYSELVD